ncbi:PREDICTED: amine sulfotransferase-like [Nanorana parkeri]|uniref:amine sulfotransferase-like n=1 Tax=Nanorana parkeri TaxID=125878 RepID=UPI0008543443|nr:PREDICTED: amine sulfotransferase-like [Nanorana parkeri]
MAQEGLEEALNYFVFKHKGIYFQTDVTTPEVIDSLEHMEIRDSDVFLVTYPKSGTIWSQQVLNLIFHEGHRKGLEDINNMARAPWIEYNLYNINFDSRQSPRLFTSHLPYYLMPKDLRFKRGKIIYVCRNPKDAMVSFYHFYKLFSRLHVTLDLETFLDLFLSGRVICGSWFDHFRGWYTHKEDYNILFLTYEEMKKDLRSAVMKICNFVDIKLDDQAVDTIVEKSSFSTMRQDPLANYEFIPKDLLDFKKGDFLRKGTVGDWKNTMTVTQSEMFDRVYKEKMKDLPIKFLWDINDEEAGMLK